MLNKAALVGWSYSTSGGDLNEIGNDGENSFRGGRRYGGRICILPLVL